MAAHWLPIGLKRILLQNSKPLRTRQSSWNFGSATHSLEVSKKTDVSRTWCSMSWIMLCQPYKTMAWTIQDEHNNLRSPWMAFLPKKRAQEACLNPRNSSAVVYYMCIYLCMFLFFAEVIWRDNMWMNDTLNVYYQGMSWCHSPVTLVFTSETPHITGAKLIKAGALAKSFLSNLPRREPHSCQMTKESYDLTVLTKRELRSNLGRFVAYQLHTEKYGKKNVSPTVASCMQDARTSLPQGGRIHANVESCTALSHLSSLISQFSKQPL